MKEGKSKPKRKYITVYTFLMTHKYAKIWNSGICRVMRIQCRPSTSGAISCPKKEENSYEFLSITILASFKESPEKDPIPNSCQLLTSPHPSSKSVEKTCWSNCSWWKYAKNCHQGPNSQALHQFPHIPCSLLKHFPEPLMVLWDHFLSGIWSEMEFVGSIM